MTFADLHAHPYLPWVGDAWRRKLQGIRLPAVDGTEPRAGGYRLHGAVCYETYLLSPRSARRKILARLEAYRRRLAGNLILGRTDLGKGLPDAYLLAVESLRWLRDPGDVRRLWDLGARSLQPVHFLETTLGGSSREGFLPPSRGGLTSLGRETLAEMASLGMLLDLSHMNLRTAEDCLAAYPGSVFCSHNGLAEVRPTARNLPASLAREVFRRGGIVGVTCWRHLLGPDPGPHAGSPRPGPRAAWTRAICATADAFARLAPGGRARVAIGSDRGAPFPTPAWLFSPPHLAELSDCLQGLGWTAGEAGDFLGGNALGWLGRALPGR